MELSQDEFPAYVNYYSLSLREKMSSLIGLIKPDVSIPRSNCEVLLIVGGGTLIEIKGKVTNWLIGDLIQELESTKLIYMGAVSSNNFSNLSCPDIQLYSRIARHTFFASLMARIIPKTYFKDLDQHIDEVCFYFLHGLSKEVIKKIKTNMRITKLKLTFEDRMWKKILNRLKPKVLVIEDASYGSMSNLVRIAKLQGLVVVEPQHGWIGPSHGSYNYGTHIYNEHSDYLPDYILTYGKYWAEGIRHPGSMIPIGKPVLNRLGLSCNKVQSHKTLLLTSSGSDINRFVELAINVSRELDKFAVNVKLRLHPSERDRFKDQVISKLYGSSVELDSNFDVYASLLTSNWVAGFSSTVLFEAIALGVKPIALESPLSDYYSDPSFMAIAKNEVDLIRFVTNGLDSDKDTNLRLDIWANNSENTIRIFFGQTLDIGLRKKPQI